MRPVLLALSDWDGLAAKLASQVDAEVGTLDLRVLLKKLEEEMKDKDKKVEITK